MRKYIDEEVFKEWIENWFYKHKSYHPYAKTNTIPITELYDLLEQMPAADVQDVVRCKDCKHREYDDFMKEPVCDLDAADPYDRSRCAENDEWFCKDGERKYIDKGTERQHLIERLYETALNDEPNEAVYIEIIKNRLPVWLDEIPPADVAEVRHGRWHIEAGVGKYCTVCGFDIGNELDFMEYVNYCPNCGSRMDAE